MMLTGKEVLKLKEQVLILRRKVFGPEHPDTLHAMNTATELNARCDKDFNITVICRRARLLQLMSLPQRSPLTPHDPEEITLLGHVGAGPE